MKTSDLKKWLDEKGHEYTFIGNEITFRNSFNQILIIVLTDEQRIYLDSWIYMKDEIALLKKIIEYTETPISEREDERKYAFELWHKANLSMETKYLKFDRKLELYYLNKNEVENSQFQRIFTQQEIDNFPAEIKGAIECGFLKKVEVK